LLYYINTSSVRRATFEKKSDPEPESDTTDDYEHEY
jgi:hypothetical protein